jgi:hypothetical protein
MQITSLRPTPTTAGPVVARERSKVSLPAASDSCEIRFASHHRTSASSRGAWPTIAAGVSALGFILFNAVVPIAEATQVPVAQQATQAAQKMKEALQADLPLRTQVEKHQVAFLSETPDNLSRFEMVDPGSGKIVPLTGPLNQSLVQVIPSATDRNKVELAVILANQDKGTPQEVLQALKQEMSNAEKQGLQFPMSKQDFDRKVAP